MLNPCSVSRHLSVTRANLGLDYEEMFHRSGLGRVWGTSQMLLSACLSLKQVLRMHIPLVEMIVFWCFVLFCFL